MTTFEALLIFQFPERNTHDLDISLVRQINNLFCNFIKWQATKLPVHLSGVEILGFLPLGRRDIIGNDKYDAARKIMWLKVPPYNKQVYVIRFTEIHIDSRKKFLSALKAQVLNEVDRWKWHGLSYTLFFELGSLNEM